jgi:hypothetical protein
MRHLPHEPRRIRPRRKPSPPNSPRLPRPVSFSSSTSKASTPGKKHRAYLRGDIIAVGLGLNDDNWHSPNEKMDLDNFHRGIAMSAELLQRLGGG